MLLLFLKYIIYLNISISHLSVYLLIYLSLKQKRKQFLSQMCEHEHTGISMLILWYTYPNMSILHKTRSLVLPSLWIYVYVCIWINHMKIYFKMDQIFGHSIVQLTQKLFPFQRNKILFLYPRRDRQVGKWVETVSLLCFREGRQVDYTNSRF